MHPQYFKGFASFLEPAFGLIGRDLCTRLLQTVAASIE